MTTPADEHHDFRSIAEVLRSTESKIEGLNNQLDQLAERLDEVLRRLGVVATPNQIEQQWR
jgi:hypothetical protein